MGKQKQVQKPAKPKTPSTDVDKRSPSGKLEHKN
jgi:hypothetical protein